VRSGKLEEALKLLARHLHERGKLNLEEAFVDATFASAKKGASPSVPLAAARERRSSLSPLVTVFLSPYLSKALRLPSASLWKRLLPEAFSRNSRPGSSATKPTTRKFLDVWNFSHALVVYISPRFEQAQHRCGFGVIRFP
jgi:hypothetical protein